MEKLASTVSGANEPSSPRWCGHRRSSSLPVAPAVQETKAINGGETALQEDGKEMERKRDSVNLAGLADTFNQISESLSRPAKILREVLDQKNANVEKAIQSAQHNSGNYLIERVETALKQLTMIQGNLKHVLPHMELILKDYKTMKERTQPRDEMLKTFDKALRRSESRARGLRDELQDIRDENKCLREKAQQNESILRFLHTDKTGSGDQKVEHGHPRSCEVEQCNGQDYEGRLCATDFPSNVQELGAKLGHYQKVLCDYERQLHEVVLLNKELVLKINERESEVMSLNCELVKHQETLAVYEQGFKNLSKDNNQLDVILREERKRSAELSEKLDDTEGYISCVTDKVTSYEVELNYLRQELKKRDNENA